MADLPPDDFMKHVKPLGWSRDGVLHLLPGITLEEIQNINGWGFMGRIVDSEGTLLKEAVGLPNNWEDWDDWNDDG